MSLALPAQSVARSASPPQGGGAGNWIISPDKLFPIKVQNAKGQAGKRYQELLDDPATSAATSGARRYASKEAAGADAQVMRNQRKATTGVSRAAVAKVAWFNTSSKRIVAKPAGFTPGAGSTLKFRGDGATEAESRASTRVQAEAAGMLKPQGGGGTKRKVNPADRFIAAGKPLKNGFLAWIKVGGDEYNRKVAAGQVFPAAQFPVLSAAQKKEESARRSGRAKKSQGERDASQRAAKARLPNVRPTSNEFSLCVINPNSNRAVGVERRNGTTTGSARALAKAVGGETQATSKRGGEYVISDSQIVDIIRRNIATGKLKATTAGKKCSGGN